MPINFKEFFELLYKFLINFNEIFPLEIFF